MRRLARLVLRRWAEIIAAGGLVALVLAVNPSELARIFGHIRWPLALLMVPVTVGLYVCRGAAWWVALRRAGAQVGFRRTLAVELAGQVMIVLPLGDLARVAMIAEQEERAGTGRITATVVFQELLYMVLLSFGVLPRVAERPNIALLVLALYLLLAAILVIMLWEPAYRRAVRLVEHLPVLRQYDRQLRELRPAFIDLLRWRTLAPALGYQAMAAALAYLLFFLALNALGQSQISYLTAAFALGVSYLFGVISFLPLGLGAFEGLVTVVMVTNGIPAAVGAASGLLFRAYNDLLMAVIGAPIAARIRWRSSKAGGRMLAGDTHASAAHPP